MPNQNQQNDLNHLNHPNDPNQKWRLRDYHIAIFVVAVVAFFIIFSFFVDIYNFLGLRDWLDDQARLAMPFMWHYIFSEGGPAEVLQWLFIGLLIMLGAYISGKLHALGENKEVATFWLLFSVLAVLMMMEDAGNVRHFLKDRGTLLIMEKRIVGIMTELAYFGLMALIPAYAILRYGKYLLPSKRTAVFLLLGCFFYALAVGMSGTRDIMFWYDSAGELIYQWTAALGGAELLELYQEADAFLEERGHISLQYRFMDFLVEESIELLGAGFLVTSAYSYLEYMKETYNI